MQFNTIKMFDKTNAINYAKANIKVECVLFAFIDETIKVMLIKQDLQRQELIEDSLLSYQLPSDFVLQKEEIENTFHRIVNNALTINIINLIPLQTIYSANFKSDVGAIPYSDSNVFLNDVPQIKLSYLGLTNLDAFKMNNKNIEQEMGWYALKELPALSSENSEIINQGIQELKNRIYTQAVIFELLPTKFTLGQLQKIYELILGYDLDKRNFRKQILKKGILKSLQERQKQVSHKRAQFFEFDKEKYQLQEKTKLFSSSK